MKKIKRLKYRIAFGAVFILSIIIVSLLDGAKIQEFFIPNMAGILICAVAIFVIWNKFQLTKWGKKAYRFAQKQQEQV